MQIVETANEGLKRAYTVTIPAGDIASRIDGEIKRIAPQVQMPGFRPGKVPANLVRKRHGDAIHQDVLQNTIREVMDQLVTEHKLRPAMQPDIELGDGYEQGKDATLTVSLEVLPQIEAPAIDGLKLERLVVPVADADVDESLETLASQQKRFSSAPDDRVAENGDQLIADFVGKLDGVAFEGGSAEDQAIELGAKRMIPGFEEQLVGVKKDEDRQISVTFPEDYGAKHLAGKEATFDVHIKDIKLPAEQVLDDDFAKELGLENIETLKNLLRSQLEQQTAGLTRTQMKRSLLDQLAAAHDFAVPEAMVEAEFNQIMEQVRHEASHEDDPEAALKEVESETDEYRSIAVRRVRLGLLLSEIGQANKIEVSAQEMQMLVAQAAQRYRPEDRQRFAEYVQNDPMAAAQLRAPLYEDKVVDFLFDKAEVTEREVTREELEAAIEAEDGHVHGPDCDHDHDHGDKKPAKKKAAAKKATGDDADKPAKAAPKKAAAAKKAASDDDGKAVKKPAAKKSAAKAEDKAPAKKASAKKAASDDKAPAKKAAPKKAAPKKAAKDAE